jgi:hypothetical protein
MTDDDRSHDRNRGDDSVARLIQLAGPRPVIPDDVRVRVHAAVRGEWQDGYQRRRTLRWGIPFALAAAVAVALVTFVRAPEIAVSPVATVVRADGGAAGADLLPGAAVSPGVRLATGERGVALALNNGFSVRLQAGTSVTFESIESVTLDAGRLYADTGQSIYDDRSITVQTPLGTATDIGTQFAVGLGDGEMRIAVREGEVDVAAGPNTWTAEAGEMLTIGSDSGATFAGISRYDSSWEWASSLAPTYDIENRSLLDFLKWASRETGRELVFENEAARTAAMRTTLSGSIEDFTPIEAVASVLPTTRFGYRIEAQRIVISEPGR